MEDDGSTFIASSQVDGGHGADALTIEDDVLGCNTIPVQQQHTSGSHETTTSLYPIVLYRQTTLPYSE